MPRPPAPATRSSPLGTNAQEIFHAIEAAYSDSGVVVLMDLGSAVMAAEMALEFLSSEKRANVRLVAAPMVEGSIAAAVQASLGGTIDQVTDEAMGALAAKAEQLSNWQPKLTKITGALPALSDAQNVTVTIENRLGLHARPAAQFVQTAARFKSDIFIARASNDAKRVNAKSINAVASFGARQNEVIHIYAAGPDEAEPLAGVANFSGVEIWRGW